MAQSLAIQYKALCVSFLSHLLLRKKDKPETKRRHRHVNGRITYQELTNRLNDVEVLTCKIGNGWKSFNTRTIESSPVNRSTSCIRRVCGFSFSLTLCLVLPATQYQVQLMYQHGSATPDTFSRLPVMKSLPQLRSPDLQHPEVGRTTQTSQNIVVVMDLCNSESRYVSVYNVL